MYAIEISTTFCAAHALRLPSGPEALHGHNFHVTARLTAQRLDGMQTVVDFHLIEQLLDAILAPWQNQNLNQIEPFRGRVNPSAERIAEHIGIYLQASIANLPDSPDIARGLRVVEIRLTEAPNCLAIWQA